ncbi:DNA-binding NarL/FixJ family response regulator [Nocardioides salarius]|uniref:DNA-binding NarL/FixJ family response regulator n=1 Tax=Nocardioides salarius TaxID=374513 RepID=A0ABS2M7E9_9ACTN|nr:response regulator transcription factor [Nocardioides salarius]MBM7507115.1 DNA-binding NarL/FixJ family response regulator [Nocardioides salarius]
MTVVGVPVRVAIVNDHPIVVAGVAAVLEPYADRVRVVEIVTGAEVRSEVDVVLYDTFGQDQGDGVDLPTLVDDGRAKVVVFSWNTEPDLVERALARGASGYLSKQVTGQEMAWALQQVAAGAELRPQDVGDSALPEVGAWPGRDRGLTAREAEVLALICAGLSNQQIAERTYLSINSVKTYIRTAYRKIGAGSRSQAVAWAMQHGFRPERVRVLRPTTRDPRSG